MGLVTAQDSSRRALLIAAPPLLIATTAAAFYTFVRAFGPTAGYLCGFVFYWLVWCAAVPTVVLGWQGVRALFQPSAAGLGRPAWLGALAVAVPLVLGYGYAFPRALIGATPASVLLSAAIAIVNAPLEELLWRGAYVTVFRQARVLSYVYPNICFGLWHLVPLSVVPNRAPGGKASFVLASCIVGFLWGWIALDTRSVRVTSTAHALFDFSGLGGRLYLG